MKQNSFLVILVLSLMALVSCEKSEHEIKPDKPQAEAIEEYKMMKLGEKLKNPYTVKNMKKAKKNLQSSGIDSDLEITTTHLYIRFIPKTQKDLDTLKADTSLFLFDHPLDYEIEEEGHYYHDPAIPEYEPTYMYTAVEVDYNLPPVAYEILAELFLPEETEQDTMQIKSTGSVQDYFFQLEDEALRITDNLEEKTTTGNQSKSTKGLFKKKKRPKGTIEVWNTEINRYEPVKQVFVRTRRWFKFGKDYTNAKGYYRINQKYRRNPKYKVVFKAKKWKIWKNRLWWGAARYNMGRHSKKGYDKRFARNSWAWSLATVNNAVYDYRYTHCNTYDINKPPRNLRVWVFNTNNVNTAKGSAAMLKRTWGFYGWHPKKGLNTLLNYMCGLNLGTTLVGNLVKFVSPDITISTPKRKSNKNTLAIYETTCHELSHASHWTKAGNRYWVKYINHIITYKGYGSGSGNNAGYCGVGEMWGNYFGAVCANDKYSSYSWWSDFHAKEDWYNPGFLRNCVKNINDLSTNEVFDCLTKNTNTIDKMVNQIKRRTKHDKKVDNQYNSIDTDWP